MHVHSEPETVTRLGNSIFEIQRSRDEIILDLGWAINPMTGGPITERRGRFGQRERDKQSNVKMSQRLK